MNAALFRKKTVQQVLAEAAVDKAHSLKKTLGPIDLIFMGIGCIIGTGIFVVTGVAAAKDAGPAIMLSFVVSGIACALAALCYAEFAALLPISGSAYTYSYATMGELIAWIIGWDLILEYGISAAAIAVGWSGYFNEILNLIGIHLPAWATTAYLTDPKVGVVDIPAALVILAIAGVLAIGIRESATVNGIMVAVKVSVLLLFIGVGAFHLQPQNWTPFAPFGFKGIMAGAAIAFFAYIGFDAVSTTAEEARNPQRDLPIGIIGSLIISTILYMATAGVLTGVVPYPELNTKAPMATALTAIGIHWGSALVSIGAITGIASVILVTMLGQSRIFFAMARDGLLPPFAGRIHPRFRTPALMTMLTGGLVAVLGAVVPLEIILELTNIGTLFAFALVSAAVIILRRTDPDHPRPFRVPGSPVVPVLAILSCAYLMINLPWQTWVRFGLWMAAGMVFYFLYGYRRSRLGQTPAAGR